MRQVWRSIITFSVVCTLLNFGCSKSGRRNERNSIDRKDATKSVADTPTVKTPNFAELQDSNQSSSDSSLTLSNLKVIAIHDGDTLTVLDLDKRQLKIRLAGIDAPELKQDFGSRSKENLSTLVFGKLVTLACPKTDKYQRLVCTLTVDDKDINLAQVEAGLAWHYKKYAKEQSPEQQILYSETEKRAKDSKLGLWSQSSPIAPWDWRLRH
jgi:endonuclease YncB( thermonuclease family)